LAMQAWLVYGKGRHPAALNFADCFSYALAKACRRTAALHRRGLFPDRYREGVGMAGDAGSITTSLNSSPPLLFPRICRTLPIVPALMSRRRAQPIPAVPMPPTGNTLPPGVAGRTCRACPRIAHLSVSLGRTGFDSQKIVSPSHPSATSGVYGHPPGI
jgi:hypothetical protein